MEKQFNEAANKGGVYRIVNKINGYPYIGSTNRFKKRCYDHEWSLRNHRHQNKKLQRSFNKYKEDAFIFEVLEVVEATADEIIRRTVEQKYLDEIKDWRRCYNTKKKTIQKQGPWSNTPEETRKKMSDVKKGKPGGMKGKHQTEEAKRKIGEANKGKHNSLKTEFKKGQKLSEETKKKISKTLKGKKPKNLEQLQKNNVGKKRTEESKRKMSEVHKGRKHSAETKKKMSEAHKGNKNMVGKKLSDKTRQKMKEAQKKRRFKEKKTKEE